MPTIEYVRYCHYEVRSENGRFIFTYGIEELDPSSLDPAPALAENERHE
jgi:hypothetical protein